MRGAAGEAMDEVVDAAFAELMSFDLHLQTRALREPARQQALDLHDEVRRLIGIEPQVGGPRRHAQSDAGTCDRHLRSARYSFASFIRRLILAISSTHRA